MADRTVCGPLCLRSRHTLLSGTAAIETLLDRAARVGYTAVALTDENNLYGVVPFVQEAKKRGLKPVPGAQLVHGPDRLGLLVQNRRGYTGLCRILSARHLEEDFDLVETVAGNAEGLFLVVPEADLLARLAAALEDRTPLLAALCRPTRSQTAENALLAAAARHGIPVVAADDVYLLEDEDRPLARLLAAIRTHTVVERIEEGVVPPHCTLPTPTETEHAYRDIPDALTARNTLAEACTFTLDLGRPIFPHCPLPEGETPLSHLYKICHNGLQKRYRPITTAALERLARELRVIDDLGFPEYFVIVGDIVRFACSSGIPVVGRGSGAGSLVAYVLGITSVDPLHHRLAFERFLHRRRRDLPDLDVDLCWRGRDEVIDHVYRTYGRDHVAMISTHNTFGPRSAFREAARAYGVPPPLVDRVSRRIPHAGDVLLRDILRPHLPVNEDPFRILLPLAQRLVGAPHHLGIHPGGIVIGRKPLDHHVPLERATKGIVVTQFEMHAAEAVGLVKIDLLGNRALTEVREAGEWVREAGGRIDIDSIPANDGKTGDLLETGRTLGCFQLESPGMRNLLKQLRTRTMDDCIAALALIRPGPAGAGMKEAFIRRNRGLDPSDFHHPALERVLAKTHGIMLFEEDVLYVAEAVAGMTLEEGDLLRRALKDAGKDAEKMRHLGNRFMRRAIMNDVEPDQATRVWEALRQFGGYAFNKAHAAGYGVLAYQTAYLKAHHPAAFMASVFNNHAGMYGRNVHLEEAKRLGVKVLPPCVNQSREGFTVEENAVRVGLGQIRLLSARRRAALLDAREKRPFSGIGDLLGRVPMARREAESLILAGALDFTEVPRSRLMWRLAAAVGPMRKNKNRGRGADLFAGEFSTLPAPDIPEYDDQTRMEHEMRSLELTVGPHPMTLVRPDLGRYRHLTDSRAFETLRTGTRTTVAGLRIAQRRTPTRNGDVMAFLTLEDEWGVMEVTLFPDVFRRERHKLHGAGPFLVIGTLEEQYGARTLNGRTVEVVKQ